MKVNPRVEEKPMLMCRRLPARLNVDEAAEVLGFLPHEISVLMRVGLLKPLGKPAPNAHKFFCSRELVTLSEDREWLDKATRAVTKHWKDRNLASPA